jgi:hypothetical protein
MANVWEAMGDLGKATTIDRLVGPMLSQDSPVVTRRARVLVQEGRRDEAVALLREFVLGGNRPTTQALRERPLRPDDMFSPDELDSFTRPIRLLRELVLEGSPTPPPPPVAEEVREVREPVFVG